MQTLRSSASDARVSRAWGLVICGTAAALGAAAVAPVVTVTMPSSASFDAAVPMMTAGRQHSLASSYA